MVSYTIHNFYMNYLYWKFQKEVERNNQQNYKKKIVTSEK